MHIKHLTFALIFSLSAIGIYASNDNDTIRSRKAKDPFYLQLYVGVNKSANENLPWTEFTKYPLSTGLFLGMGREFTKLWGWRVALRLNNNKSRNVRKCETPETWKWNNIGLFPDITFDVTDALSKKTGRFNLKAFAGIGLAYTFAFDDVPLSYTHAYSRKSRLLPGARAGLTATYLVSRNIRIGAELSHNIYSDHFNGVKANAPIDMRTNLKLGVSWLFMPKSKKQKRVVLDNRLHTIPALPFKIPDTEDVKKRRIAGRAFLDFPVNETVIYPEYRRNPEELKRIRATIDSALFDKTIQVTEISLHGYASPESPYSNNERLSKGRVRALQGYLRSKYGFDYSLFSLENTPEDWENLRNFISDGYRRRIKDDIWYENVSVNETPEIPDFVMKYRDDLLRVIDMQIDEDEKELLLKQVGNGEPYKWLLKHVYPGLRHTDYIVEYVVRHYNVEEARKLIYTHPEALSLNEMYHVANSYRRGSDGWLDAMLIAAKMYPDDITANLNASCACILTKRMIDARRYLRFAGNTDDARYVADIISAMEGTADWKLVNDKVIIIK